MRELLEADQKGVMGCPSEVGGDSKVDTASTTDRVPPGCPSSAEFDGMGWNRKEEDGTTNLGNSK
jgi:hypothetical protein